MRRICLPLVLIMISLLPVQGQVAMAQDLAFFPGPVSYPQKSNPHDLKELLQTLESKFGVYFTFESKVVQGKHVPEDVNITKDLEETLLNVLGPFNLDFKKIAEGYYTIFPKKTSGPQGTKGNETGSVHSVHGLMNLSFNRTLAPFEFAVSGVVKDQNQEPIPGVNILEKGTTNGTASDADGKFTLTVSGGDVVLVFSFIGFVTREIPLNARASIDVTLSEEVQRLSEVVVVGYGTQKKATVTGSVTSVATDKVKNNPSVSVSNSLAGLLPGLTALNRSGAPGNNVSQILIRGQSTTGNTSPLVVVDGIPDETGAWLRINQNDIDQISVLKDASAAIYGARAANGVILITTKRGGTGKPVFNYSFNQGFVVPTRLPEVADSWDWAGFVNQRLEEQNLPPRYTSEEIQKMKEGSDPINYANTDWAGELLKPYALQSMHNLNLRGGTDSLRYSISGSYANENSIIRDGLHGFDSYTLRSNIDAQVSPNIRLSLDLNGGIDDRIAPESGSFYYLYFFAPTYPVTWPNGSPSAPPSDQGENPIINFAGAGGYSSLKTQRTLMKASFDIKIPAIQGVGVDGYFSYSTQNTQDKTWREPWETFNYDSQTDTYTVVNGGSVDRPDLQQEVTRNLNYLFNLRVKYERQFGKHYVNSFVAVEQAEGSFDRLLAYRKDYVSSAVQEIFAGGVADMKTDGSKLETARQNVFGRVSYNFREKYLVDLNLRYDGSYAFPKGKRWGFFPGISAAWRVSEENFMAGATFVDDLKVRASYGRMGNDQIAAYQFLSKYVLRSAGTHFGSPRQVQPTIAPGVIPNPNITWEVASTQNLGIDAEFREGTYGFTLDVFKQRRSNILTKRNLEMPAYSALELPDENIGIVENKGIELTLSHRNRAAGSAFSYAISGNLAFARNKVVDLSEATNVPEYQKAEGHILGAGLYYQAIGIFRTEQEIDTNPVFSGTQVGDLQYADINEDGIINAADRVRIDKSNIPNITFGLNASLRYKALSFFVNFAGQAKAWQYYHQNARTGFNGLRDLIVNRYTPGSMDSKYPRIPEESRPDAGDVSGITNTFWLEDVSFLRLKTIQLDYTIPGALVSRIGLNSMRIYLSGNNLLTFTQADWFDPEGASTRGTFYPQTKIFNLGVNLSF